MKSMPECSTDHCDAVIRLIGQLGHKMGQHLMVAEGYSSMLQSRVQNGSKEFEYLVKIKQQIALIGEIKHQMMEIARPDSLSK